MKTYRFSQLKIALYRVEEPDFVQWLNGTIAQKHAFGEEFQGLILGEKFLYLKFREEIEIA